MHAAVELLQAAGHPPSMKLFDRTAGQAGHLGGPRIRAWGDSYCLEKQVTWEVGGFGCPCRASWAIT